MRIFYPPFDREQLVEMLEQKVGLLKEKLPLKLTVLFGSYAEGRHTVASDIDLLVVYRGKAREDAYRLVKRTFNIPRLEPHVYCEADYERMRETLEPVLRNGVVIVGRC